jgi:hypothetical protein
MIFATTAASVASVDSTAAIEQSLSMESVLEATLFLAAVVTTADAAGCRASFNVLQNPLVDRFTKQAALEEMQDAGCIGWPQIQTAQGQRCSVGFRIVRNPMAHPLVRQAAVDILRADGCYRRLTPAPLQRPRLRAW